MAKKSQNYAIFTHMSLVKRARSVVVKCHRKNERTLEILLQNSANIEARDDFGGTVLHNAASLSDCSDKSVEMLIQMGAKIDAKNPNGYTPLHFAALQGWKNSNSMMEIFLKKGANIEAENNMTENLSV